MSRNYLELYRANCFKRFQGAQLEIQQLSLDAILHPEGSHVAFVKNTML